MLRECEISAIAVPELAVSREFLPQWLKPVFSMPLYPSTRLHEIAGFGWPAAQQEMFLRMQFNAQYRSYEAAYGRAEHHIVEQDGNPVGRIMVLWEKDFALLVDIALLAEHRGRTIGGELLRDLIQKCARKRVP